MYYANISGAEMLCFVRFCHLGCSLCLRLANWYSTGVSRSALYYIVTKGWHLCNHHVMSLLWYATYSLITTHFRMWGRAVRNTCFHPLHCYKLHTFVTCNKLDWYQIWSDCKAAISKDMCSILLTNWLGRTQTILSAVWRDCGCHSTWWG